MEKLAVPLQKNARAFVSRNRRRLLTAFALTVLAVVLAFSIPTTRHWLYRLAGHALVEVDPLSQCDIVVVLGGDFLGNRVIKGAELAKAGFAKRVFISGPPYIQDGHRVAESDLAIQLLEKKGFDRKILVGFLNSAQSTSDEAIAFRPIFRTLSTKRVLLVTSNYHSRRAGLIFRILSPNVKFVVVGCPEPNFNPDRWWTTQISNDTFFREWAKMCWNLGISVWTHAITGIFS